MRILSLFLGLLCFQKGFAQQLEAPKPIANLRVSFLLFPFSPLLTLEVRTLGNLTLQLESNFTDTHGINLKYYLQNSMDGGYLFTGLALVENQLLREDANHLLALCRCGLCLPMGQAAAMDFRQQNRFGSKYQCR